MERYGQLRPCYGDKRLKVFLTDAAHNTRVVRPGHCVRIPAVLRHVCKPPPFLRSLLPAQGVKGRCHLRPGHCRVRMEFPRRLKDPVIGQIACRIIIGAVRRNILEFHSPDCLQRDGLQRNGLHTLLKCKGLCPHCILPGFLGKSLTYSDTEQYQQYHQGRTFFHRFLPPGALLLNLSNNAFRQTGEGPLF